MSYVHIRVIAIVAALFAGASVRAADSPPRSDASVLVFVRDIGSERMGSAFVVGDGSLVVTARHVLYGNSMPGRSESLGIVTILSPYLGEAVEGHVIAEDPALDIAILRAATSGHPTFELAEDRALLDATSVDVRGYGKFLKATRENNLAAMIEPLAVESLTLGIDTVGIRLSELRTLTTIGAGVIDVGWSGSAMFLPGTDRVVGGVSTMHGLAKIVGAKRTGMTGFASAQIRKLITSAEANLAPATQPIARPEDAQNVTRLFQQLIAASMERDWPAIIRFAEATLAVRPNNVFAHLGLASACGKLNRKADAETYYKKAIQLEPQSIAGRLDYGQFLVGQGKLEEALSIFDQVRRSYPKQTMWAIGSCNVLREAGKNEQCVALLKDALRESPNNALLWTCLGQSQHAMKNDAEAVIAFERAVELAEELIPARFLLAQSLEAIGKLDRAEDELRTLARVAPDNTLYLFVLMNFLANHHPDKYGEAIAMGQRLLTLPPLPGTPPREVIEKVTARLKDKAATQPATQSTKVKP